MTVDYKYGNRNPLNLWIQNLLFWLSDMHPETDSEAQTHVV